MVHGNDVYVDLGFLGITKDSEGDRIKNPVNRQKRTSKIEPIEPFSEAEKEYNKKLSSERIPVENAIGRMNRYR